MPINTSGGINTYAQTDLSGYLPLTGGTMTGAIVLPAGTAAAPAIGWTDTGFYEGVANAIYIAVSGVDKFLFTGDLLRGALTGSPALENSAASSINPPFTFVGDYDTGIGKAAEDQLSLIAGGKEMCRLTESTAGNSINMQAPVTYVGHQFTENFLWAGAIYGTEIGRAHV